MYKQQKSFSVSSTIWALIATVVVLLIASAANAQDLPPVEAPGPTETPSAVDTALPEDVSGQPPVAEALPGPEASAAFPPNDAAAERQARLDELQARLLQKRAALEDTASGRQALLREATQSLVTTGTAQVATGLNGAIAKTRDVSVRMRAKALELEDRGTDSGAALSALNEADRLIRLAEEAVRGMDIHARYAATAADPIAEWADVQLQFSSVRDLINESHRSIREASGALRALILNDGSTAS